MVKVGELPALHYWLGERDYMAESLIAIGWAGADLILTYTALDYARSWREWLTARGNRKAIQH